MEGLLELVHLLNHKSLVEILKTSLTFGQHHSQVSFKYFRSHHINNLNNRRYQILKFQLVPIVSKLFL
jgi:hypothetical protein